MAGRATFPHPFRTPDGRDLVIDTVRKPEETQDILDFLTIHYYPIPPIRQIFEYDEFQGDFKPPDDYLEIALHCTKQPSVSLLARDTSGRLVGVLLSSIKKHPASDDEPPEDTDPNLFMTTYFREVHAGVNAFAQLETDSYFHLCVLTVSSEYAQQGIATKLYQLSLDLAMDLGVKGAITEAASIYTFKLAKKLGFETYTTVPYSAMEHKGARPFTNCPEVLIDHPTASYMGRRLIP